MSKEDKSAATTQTIGKNDDDGDDNNHRLTSTPSSKVDRVVDVEVSVIIPVHNAAATIVQAVRSAMHQVICNNPKQKYNNQQEDEQAAAQGMLIISSSSNNADDDDDNDDHHRVCYYRLQVFVCCYDDGSIDDSWSLLQGLQDEYHENDQKSLQQQQQHQPKRQHNCEMMMMTSHPIIPTRLLIGRAKDGVSRGAGFARNRAVEMRRRSSSSTNHYNFLCLLDSDDYMHPTRISEQCRYLLTMSRRPSSNTSSDSISADSSFSGMQRTLLGCTFDRDPPDATWHYAHWANNLLSTDERLVLECYREMTLIQPTWMMSRSWFQHVLGGYIEAPPALPLSSAAAAAEAAATPSSASFSLQTFISTLQAKDKNTTSAATTPPVPRLRLVHPTFETMETLRVAEDLRLFHAHLHAGGQLRLLRTTGPSTSSSCSEEDEKEPKQRQPALVTYRHANGAGQSSQTPRRLLVHLRVLAFEINVLQKHPLWQPSSSQSQSSKSSPADDNDESSPSTPCFCIWGAGRDGKDFIKALSPAMRRRVACMVDVDANKILQPHGYYTNRDINLYNLPILHFSLLCRNAVLRQELYDAFLRQSSSTSDSDDDTIMNNDMTSGKAQPAFGRINKARVVLDTDDGKDKASQQAAIMQQQHAATSSSPLATVSSSNSTNNSKKRRLHHCNSSNKHQYSQELLDMLPSLPVVVCVAMYRTGGALENNVSMIGRTEGEDLYHFC
jgi:hypothetical protein